MDRFPESFKKPSPEQESYIQIEQQHSKYLEQKKKEIIAMIKEIIRKNENGEELTDEELDLVYRAPARMAGYLFHIDTKNLINKAFERKENNELRKKDLARLYNCSPEQVVDSYEKLNEQTVVFDGDISFNQLVKSRAIEGPISLSNLFPNLKCITGMASFSWSEVVDLGNLEEIGGRVLFRDNKQLKTTGNLKRVGLMRGDYLITYQSQLESLGETLEEVYGLDARNSNLKSTGGLIKVYRDVYLGDSMIESLGKIKEIGGNLRAENSKLRDLGDLEIVEGNIDLTTDVNHEYEIGVENLNRLKYVGGRIYLNRNYHRKLEEQVIRRFGEDKLKLIRREF